MRVLIAFDKFKDSLTARQACEVVARTLRELHPDWTVVASPFTDGGDGFAPLLTEAAGGHLLSVPSSGPRSEPLTAPLGLMPAGRVAPQARRLLGWDHLADAATIAVIEMASASGLALVPHAERSPWTTTSRGTGQLIRAAAEAGARAILLGVGGSATHDLGLGALSALGYEFRTGSGDKLRPPYPQTWARLASVDGSALESIPPIRIACDVTNPLLGDSGAAAIYGPQKGLKAEDREALDQQSARLASLLCRHCGKPESLAEEPGAGAAGGIAFGLVVGLGARLVPGADLVSAWMGLEAKLQAADIVITGEGQFDATSLTGKGPGGLALRAGALGKAIHIFAGRIALADPPYPLRCHAITPEGMPLGEALATARENLSRSIRATF